RNATTAEMAKRGAEAAPKLRKAGTEALGSLHAPNLLTRITSLVNDVLVRLKGQVDEQTAIRIATEMLDPDAAAGALEQALARKARFAKRTAPVRATARSAAEILRSPVTGVAANAYARMQRQD